MKTIASLYASLSIVSLLTASPIIAAEDLNPTEHLSPARIYAEAIKYRNGDVEGFPKDAPQTLNKAESLFLPLAEQNDLKSIHNLAMIKLKQQDALSAYKWFSKAAAQDFAPSYRNLKKMEDENMISPSQRIIAKVELNQISQLPETLIIKGTLNTELSQDIRSQLAGYVLWNTSFNFSQETMEDWGFNSQDAREISKNRNQIYYQDNFKYLLVNRLIADETFNNDALINSMLVFFSRTKSIEAGARSRLISYLVNERRFDPAIYPEFSIKWMTDRELDAQLRRSLPELFFRSSNVINLAGYTEDFLELLRENINDRSYAEKLINQMSLFISFRNTDELRDIVAFIRDRNTSLISKSVIISNLLIKNPFIASALKDDIISILQDEHTPKGVRGSLVAHLLRSSLPNLQIHLPLFLNVFSDVVNEDNTTPPLEESSSTHTTPASHLLMARGLLTNPSFDLRGNFETFENFVSDNQNHYFTRAYVAAFLIINRDYTIDLNNTPLFTQFIFHDHSLQSVESFILNKLAAHPDRNIQEFITQELHTRGISLPVHDVSEEEIVHMQELFV